MFQVVYGTDIADQPHMSRPSGGLVAGVSVLAESCRLTVDVIDREMSGITEV